MDEMTLNMQKLMNEMNRMMKFSADVTHVHVLEHANRFQGGPGPFGLPTFHNVDAGPVPLLGLPPKPLLPPNDGMNSPQNKKVDSDDLEAPGSGNPQTTKQQRTNGLPFLGRVDTGGGDFACWS